MRKFYSFLFRLIILFPFGLLFVYVVSLLPVYEFSWFYAFIFTVCLAFVKPKSIYAWEVILDYYQISVPGISRLKTKVGIFNDMDEERVEGFTIFTSVIDDGIVLYKGHVIPFLRESAVIPWDKIESFILVDNTPVSNDGLVDQVSDMIAKLQFENVTTTLEIPWSKEIEMYANLYKDGVIKNATNKTPNDMDSSVEPPIR